MEKRKSYVYKIRCKITGEFYFGSSFNAKRDWYWGGGSKIRERIAQYGKENFIKEILGEFDDRTIAHQAENHYIKQFRHDEKCLNQQLDHKFGTYGEESREKHSAAERGKTLSEEHRSKISAAQRGKTLSEETRSKIGAAMRGEKNPWYGKHRTEETKQKIRESINRRTPWNKGKKLNKETGKYE